MRTFFEILTAVIPTICMVCMMYQALYFVIGFAKKPPHRREQKKQRFAVIICGRNEENVLPHLIRSILDQHYPKELLHIFVTADNCTDRTAAVCRAAGAHTVYERTNTVQQGKGHALDDTFRWIDRDFGLESFDGYAIFDADNLLDEDYFAEVNKVFNHPHRIVTTYRNSKNIGDNWVSFCSGLWFIREARFINQPRRSLGASCLASGTGYIISHEVIRRNEGWRYFLLTEDLDFSTNNILSGETIDYCPDAIFFDEQPIRLRDSWNQRMRWTKGFYQVFGRYIGRLLGHWFFGKEYDLDGKERKVSKAQRSRSGFQRFATCYDIFFTLSPGYLFVVSTGCTIVNTILTKPVFTLEGTVDVLLMLLGMFLASYFLFWLMAIVTIYAEGKNMYCSTAKKILYSFTFPIFFFVYVPLTVIAIFCRVKWTPIRHDVSIDMEKVKSAK